MEDDNLSSNIQKGKDENILDQIIVDSENPNENTQVSTLNDQYVNDQDKIKLCDHLVLTIDDTQPYEIEEKSNFKILNKLNSLSSGDFIDEDYQPNQLNISRPQSESGDEYSNLRELNLSKNLNLKNNLNEFNQNLKETEQKEKFLRNSLENLGKINNKSVQSVLNLDNSNLYSQETVLNRNDFSRSSSLSSSYSNINSNAIKSSSNSLVNQFELKFDSLSSIEDNSKFNLNTNALSDSTLLISNNKSENEIENETMTKAHIWTETEAFINQYDQIGPSACGATAILNVLKALNCEFDVETVCKKVKINSRIPESEAHTTTLADYLFSRSVAGMNSFELIENIERASDFKITGRFFSFFPQRDINLSEWLAKWISKGAVPVALLNLQKSPLWGFIPDAWHHQMIYACDSNSIYLTNPLESKSIDLIMNELTSDSILLVRTQDVIKRFNANKYNLLDLVVMKNFSKEERKRWFDLNVLGQVVYVLRENKSYHENFLNKISNQLETLDPNSTSSFESQDLEQFSSQQTSGTSITTHVTIPASYKSGITLFAYKESFLFKEIIQEPELSIKT